MTPDLDAIEARLAAATPGPWTATYEEADRWTSITGQGYSIDGDLWMVCPEVATCEGEPGPDADLIAHAPEDLRLLLDEVKRLRAVSEAATAFIAAWEREADNIHTAADLHAALDALNAGGEG